MRGRLHRVGLHDRTGDPDTDVQADGEVDEVERAVAGGSGIDEVDVQGERDRVRQVRAASVERPTLSPSTPQRGQRGSGSSGSRA